MMARFRPSQRLTQDFGKPALAQSAAKGGDKVVGLAKVSGEHAAVATGASVLRALDSLRVAVTLFDSQERLVYCNSHYNYLFRSLPPFELLIGMAYAELIQLEIEGGEISGAQALDAQAFIERRRLQLREGEYRPLDILLSDGRIIELKARKTADGGWIVLWSDATAARHLLARLEDAIELSADAFAFWDKSDRLDLCNAAFAELHGSQSPDEIANSTFEELVRRAALRGKFAIEGPLESWIAQRLEAHRAPAGVLTTSTTSGAAYLVRERATRDGGSATVFTDVTERHRIETVLAEQNIAFERTKRALEKSKNEAKRRAAYLADLVRRLDETEAEVDTAKTTLLRTMSHELKTPLNAILGFSDLLRSAPERLANEQIGEYAALIHQAGANLFRLINQILDLTKLAANRYDLRCAIIDVNAALSAAKDAFAARAAEKGVLLTVSDSEAEIRVNADPNAISLMLGNLVENAVAFTPQGGAVFMSATREGGTTKIRVVDNGIGVAKDDLARILEPFEQVGCAMSHSHGTGLGLPLVKALAELHGGLLVLDSELGQGLTASLELPTA